mmetsp:Transcript_46761/g.105758  ORF Transcript_46761/g.105758 Transcript_46761/m.105758 type:complete len:83 (+) Transcript_46761:699-947(+)
MRGMVVEARAKKGRRARSAAAAAAAEWSAHWDEARGRHYYHHRPSGTVQWKPPELWHARALVPISSMSNNPPGLRRPELAPE